MYKKGVSFGSATKSFENINGIRDYNFQLIELPIFFNNEMVKILRYCKDNRIEIAEELKKRGFKLNEDGLSFNANNFIKHVLAT